MKKYYVVIDNEQKGPFSFEELKDKRIIASSLIWTEELDDWTEAKNIDELKSILKKPPPPIPEKTKKEKLIKTEIAAAIEIKRTFKLLLYSLAIGIISYSVIFAIEKGFSHLRMDMKWRIHYSGTFNWKTASEEEKERRLTKLTNLKRQSTKLGWKESRILYDNLPTKYHQNLYKQATENAFIPSVRLALIAFIVFIFGRYFIIVAKWVVVTSKRQQ